MGVPARHPAQAVKTSLTERVRKIEIGAPRVSPAPSSSGGHVIVDPATLADMPTEPKLVISAPGVTVVDVPPYTAVSIPRQAVTATGSFSILDASGADAAVAAASVTVVANGIRGGGTIAGTGCVLWLCTFSLSAPPSLGDTISLGTYPRDADSVSTVAAGNPEGDVYFYTGTIRTKCGRATLSGTEPVIVFELAGITVVDFGVTAMTAPSL